MLCVPTVGLVLYCAMAVPGPVEISATRKSGLPPSVKLMLPLGAAPVTVAVKVTMSPTTAGFVELDSVVVDDVSPPRQAGNRNDPIRVCQLPLVPLVWLL